jgi:exosortase B
VAAVFDRPQAGRGNSWLEWLPVLVGMLVLYVPTFVTLAQENWHRDEEAHGPIILAVTSWLLWNNRQALLDEARPARIAGYALVALSLLFYVLGRSQKIGFVEAGSLVPLMAGLLLCMRGWDSLRMLWFPVAFAVFYVPLPSIFVDWVTGPLKQEISGLAEGILYAFGYPVARSGVVLMIGPYQLLVADACAGLNSMFSLSALGVLYLYLAWRPGVIRNGLMLSAIIPIAFFANVVRTLSLMLITFHFGDEAAQGFLHGATGMLLFVVALLSFMLLDSLLRHASSRWSHAFRR